MNKRMDHEAHSKEYIDETRLSWWRPAHLSYILSAIGCQDIQTAVDVGVGGGHWTALLFGVMQHPIDIVGVDFEDHWVKSSQDYVVRKLPHDRYRATKGEANQLPLPDESFDLVTCQTLLMHLSDPIGAVREMVRVLRAGGFLLISEPMNQLNRAATSHGLVSSNPEVSNILWRVWRAFHERLREKERGDHNIAARLPTILSSFKELDDLQCYQSDVVEFAGPNHQKMSVFIDELRKEDNRSLMLDAGVLERDIKLAESAVSDLIAEMNRREEIVACPAFNFLFSARKRSPTQA